MAARMMRTQTAAMTMPTTLPPTSTSESAPPSAPASVARRGPSDSEYSPAAKRAGRPAPARSPKTRIFHSALRLTHDIVSSPLSRCSGRSLLGGRLGRHHGAGPFGVHVVVVHLGVPRPPVDEAGERGQDDEDRDDAGGAVDAVRDTVGGRAD